MVQRMINREFVSINKRTSIWRGMDALQKYNYQVSANINLYYKDKGNYIDPDIYSERLENGVRIKTDGLIGHQKIEKMISNKADQSRVYKLIRDEMFNFAWPVHVGSINQLRGLILDDRVDLTLIDIAKFYDILDRSKTRECNAKHILEECALGKAFVNEITYNWLYKYRDFSDFVEERGIQLFAKEVAESKYIAEEWIEPAPEQENEYKIKDIYLSNLIFRLNKASV